MAHGLEDYNLISFKVKVASRIHTIVINISIVSILLPIVITFYEYLYTNNTLRVWWLINQPINDIPSGLTPNSDHLIVSDRWKLNYNCDAFRTYIPHNASSLKDTHNQIILDATESVSRLYVNIFLKYPLTSSPSKLHQSSLDFVLLHNSSSTRSKTGTNDYAIYQYPKNFECRFYDKKHKHIHTTISTDILSQQYIKCPLPEDIRHYNILYIKLKWKTVLGQLKSDKSLRKEKMMISTMHPICIYASTQYPMISTPLKQEKSSSNIMKLSPTTLEDSVTITHINEPISSGVSKSTSTRYYDYHKKFNISICTNIIHNSEYMSTFTGRKNSSFTEKNHSISLIVQWIQHYQQLGVEHFYIYDIYTNYAEYLQRRKSKYPPTGTNSSHTSNSSCISDILHTYIEAGIVTIIPWLDPYSIPITHSALYKTMNKGWSLYKYEDASTNKDILKLLLQLYTAERHSFENITSNINIDNNMTTGDIHIPINRSGRLHYDKFIDQYIDDIYEKIHYNNQLYHTTQSICYQRYHETTHWMMLVSLFEYLQLNDTINMEQYKSNLSKDMTNLTTDNHYYNKEEYEHEYLIQDTYGDQYSPLQRYITTVTTTKEIQSSFPINILSTTRRELTNITMSSHVTINTTSSSPPPPSPFHAFSTSFANKMDSVLPSTTSVMSPIINDITAISLPIQLYIPSSFSPIHSYSSHTTTDIIQNEDNSASTTTTTPEFIHFNPLYHRNHPSHPSHHSKSGHNNHNKHNIYKYLPPKYKKSTYFTEKNTFKVVLFKTSRIPVYIYNISYAYDNQEIYVYTTPDDSKETSHPVQPVSVTDIRMNSRANMSDYNGTTLLDDKYIHVHNSQRNKSSTWTKSKSTPTSTSKKRNLITTANTNPVKQLLILNQWTRPSEYSRYIYTPNITHTNIHVHPTASIHLYKYNINPLELLESYTPIAMIDLYKYYYNTHSTSTTIATNGRLAHDKSHIRNTDKQRDTVDDSIIDKFLKKSQLLLLKSQINLLVDHIYTMRGQGKTYHIRNKDIFKYIWKHMIDDMMTFILQEIQLSQDHTNPMTMNKSHESTIPQSSNTNNSSTYDMMPIKDTILTSSYIDKLLMKWWKSRILYKNINS